MEGGCVYALIKGGNRGADVTCTLFAQIIKHCDPHHQQQFALWLPQRLSIKPDILTVVSMAWFLRQLMNYG